MGFPVIGVRVDGCYHPGMQSQDRVSKEPRCGMGEGAGESKWRETRKERKKPLQNIYD